MKAQHLRIGNFIYDDEGLVSKITGFKPFDYSIRCDEQEGCLVLIDIYGANGEIKKGYECNINRTRPIPLTEEWLLKMGLTKNGREEFEFKRYRLYQPVSYVNFLFCEGNLVLREIKYVHTLQNLIHAITGEELTIK